MAKPGWFEKQSPAKFDDVVVSLRWSMQTCIIVIQPYTFRQFPRRFWIALRSLCKDLSQWSKLIMVPGFRKSPSTLSARSRWNSWEQLTGCGLWSAVSTSGTYRRTHCCRPIFRSQFSGRNPDMSCLEYVKQDLRSDPSILAPNYLDFVRQRRSLVPLLIMH